MCGNLNLLNYVNCHFVAIIFLCKPWSNFYSVNVLFALIMLVMITVISMNTTENPH